VHHVVPPVFNLIWQHIARKEVGEVAVWGTGLTAPVDDNEVAPGIEAEVVQPIVRMDQREGVRQPCTRWLEAWHIHGLNDEARHRVRQRESFAEGLVDFTEKLGKKGHEQSRVRAVSMLLAETGDIE
jgi:hypothetical protein